MMFTSQVAGKTERDVIACVNCKVLCKEKVPGGSLRGRRIESFKNPPLDLFVRPIGVFSQRVCLIEDGCSRRNTDLYIHAA